MLICTDLKSAAAVFLRPLTWYPSLCMNPHYCPPDPKRRSAFHEDLWSIKYLPKFKWHHLTEDIGKHAQRTSRGLPPTLLLCSVFVPS